MRVQAAAVETLLALAQLKDAALSSLASLFLKPEKATQWKRVLGRCAPFHTKIPHFFCHQFVNEEFLTDTRKHLMCQETKSNGSSENLPAPAGGTRST